MRHFKWDYEMLGDNHYRIYAVTEYGEDVLSEPAYLYMPETAINDEIVQKITSIIDNKAKLLEQMEKRRFEFGNVDDSE